MTMTPADPDVLRAVIAALQPMEELSGPDVDTYCATLEAVILECNRRLIAVNTPHPPSFNRSKVG